MFPEVRDFDTVLMEPRDHGIEDRTSERVDIFKDIPEKPVTDDPEYRDMRRSETALRYEDNRTKVCGAWLRVRYIITALLFLALVLGNASRNILAVTIIAMLNNTVNPKFPQFDWHDEGREGLVLSSFFWAYAVVQIPNGILVQMVGFRWPLLVGMLASSICVGMTPIAAFYGDWIATCTVRVLQGIFLGTLYPCTYAALAIWTPLEERGRLVNTVMCGSQIGIIVAFPVAGFLISSPWGWPSAFYLFGGCGLLWSTLWYFLGASAPGVHPFIRREESLLIETSISNEFKIKLKIPWAEIFKCPSMWALIVCHCSQSYGFWSLMTEIPIFMDAMLGFKIEENGLLSALPYAFLVILSFIFGAIADYFYKNNTLPPVACRRLFNSIGFGIPAIALIVLGYIAKEHYIIATSLLVVVVGFNAGVFGGFTLGHMDLAPNFSGILVGITNCAANIFSIISALVASEILREDKKDAKLWQIVFTLNAAFLFFGNLYYISVIKADRQPWNEPNYNR